VEQPTHSRARCGAGCDQNRQINDLHITGLLGNAVEELLRFDPPAQTSARVANEELRLDRLDPKPISFGHGMHFCLRASLARLETRVALSAFLASFGEYTVDLSTARWAGSHTLRTPCADPCR
jgi:cytochrome P450